MKYDHIVNVRERSAHSLVLEEIKKDSIVLEFGCATGYMTKYLKEVLNCRVYIVECDEEAYQEAQKFSFSGICSDIMDFSWVAEFKDILLDYIIFADVLEHLIDPDSVLKKCNNLLKDEGSILVSLPNIGNDSILANLYYNQFNYTDTGLLDESHLRFFGFYNLEPFFHKAGYKITKQDAIYIGLENTEQAQYLNKNYADINYVLAEREYGDVYQFILKLQKICYVEENNIISEDKILSKLHTMMLFMDTGSGYNDSEIIVSQSKYDGESYSAHFDIAENVNALRIDPLEGYTSKIQILGWESNIKIDDVVPFNSTSPKEKDYDLFLTRDPIYEIKGDLQNIEYFKIKLKINRLNPYDAIELLSRINYETSLAVYTYQIDLDDLAKLNEYMDSQIQKMELENRNMKEALATKECLLNKKDDELNYYKNSLSWRITKPLRICRKLLKGF